MSFGFSFGDFVAAGNLISQITKALRESTGASAEFQELVSQLEVMATVLLQVQNLIGTSQLPLDTIDAIVYFISKSRKLLEKFSNTMEKYRNSLQPVFSPVKYGMRRRAEDRWKKISWGLLRREDIVELRDGLRDSFQAIALILSTCSL